MSLYRELMKKLQIVATGTFTATILVNIDEEIYNDDESVLGLASIRGHQMEQAEY